VPELPDVPAIDGTAKPIDPAPLEEPAPIEGDAGYDHAAILAAYRGGDETALTAKDREILEKCRELIGSLITDDMTIYEKELALHDWLVGNTHYDEATLDVTHPHDPDNETPYGPLLRGKATCLGYTTAFQLFMDMLEIPCIIVNGFAREAEEHAWNMVQLDGDWYAVDVTWDDPLGLPFSIARINHMFFNVTSDFLRDNDHQWEDSTVPEATATEYAWRA
jgi:transglutaminase/protease-like cytokinesis protein 3